MPKISVESNRDDSELDIVRAGMRAHTEQHVQWQTYEDVTIALRGDNGQFLGAALGEAGRGWLHISVIWVDEAYRRQGFGGQLLAAMETEAKSRGCTQAYLDTFSYQARPFYEKFGYTVFGSLEDYPPGHTRYFMRKRF